MTALLSSAIRTLKESEVRESLSVEVFKPGFFFGRELLGRTVLPLFSARHSNKVSVNI